MAGTTWAVTAQLQTTQLYGGRFVKGVEVSFTTGAGNSGSVFVPEDQYNPGAVQAAVSAKAAAMDAVGGLRGQ
jgi:hypothetical protein